MLNKYTLNTAGKEEIDIIHRMARLAEYRKGGDDRHIDRIRGYTNILARGLELGSGEVEVISYASQLHDIGEVSLPDSVLAKSGQLSPSEWELVRQHPQVGAEILRGSPSLVIQAAEIIALTHHERWDGSGYPRALQGEAIPLSGRICALADVFDALTTKRAYKDETPVEEAVDLIKDASGQLFDPRVVGVFLDKLDDIIRFRKANL